LWGFHSGQHGVAPPVFTFGESYVGDQVFGVTIYWNENQHINLSSALRKTLEFLKGEFPEIVPAPPDGRSAENRTHELR
jgi:hypothetical protein